MGGKLRQIFNIYSGRELAACYCSRFPGLQDGEGDGF